MIRLGLIRHGHTHWNRAGQIQGRCDIPLDVDARAELANLRLPEDWRTAHLCASPLKRAVETAQLVADRDPDTIPALTEMNWGDWEGRKGVNLLAEPGSGYKHIEDWGWEFHPPNGESVGQLRDRLAPWVASLTQDTLAVCHIGIMRVLLAQAYGWNFNGPAPFKVKRGRIFVLHVRDGQLEPGGEPVRLIQRIATP